MTSSVPLKSENDHPLEEILIALQKSISRVNTASQANRLKNDNKPTAQIIGSVEFEIELSIIGLGSSNNDNSSDKLLVRLEAAHQGSSPSAAATLKLKGSIDPDIIYD